MAKLEEKSKYLIYTNVSLKLLDIVTTGYLISKSEAETEFNPIVKALIHTFGTWPGLFLLLIPFAILLACLRRSIFAMVLLASVSSLIIINNFVGVYMALRG